VDEHLLDELALARHALSRRSMLKGLGAFAAGAALSACTSSAGPKAGSPTTTVRRGTGSPSTSLSGATSSTLPHVVRKPDSLPNPTMAEGTDTLPQIEHIVVLMMENHSYDDHFGMLKRGDGFKLGADGLPLDANPYNGQLLKAFHMPSSCQLEHVPSQAWNASHLAFDNGRNDGFVKASGPVAMGYWDSTDIPFYYGLAETFPVCDRFFCSVLAQTYPNRRFLIAGTAAGIVSTSNDALLAPAPPNGTIFERLDAHDISWRNYYNDLPSVAVIPSVYTKHTNNFVRDTSHFITDAAAGKLPAFSVVDPNFGHQSEEDPQDVRVGEQFAAGIINAVMHGPAWDKTLLIWTFDEHGGYYDHVPPPPAVRPDGIPPKITSPPDLPGAYDRYGFRVPTVIVSPFARRDYVSHVTHDITSILGLVETKWNLPALTHRDANADNLLDSLDLDGDPAFRDPPKLPDPALPATANTQALAAQHDACTEGDPRGPIPPPDAVVPMSEASRLRIGAS
jgi:phospholipase C